MSVNAEQLRHLLDLSRILSVTIDLDHLIPSVARITCEMLKCQRASVFFHDPDTCELWTKVAIGSPPIRLPHDKGLAGHVFQSATPLLVPDVYADTRFNRQTDQLTGFRTTDLLTVPMVDLNGKSVGVIQALNSLDGFTQTHLELLQLVADQAGVAVQRHHLNQQVIESAQMRKEMQLAAKVQLELLPKEIPQLQSIDVAGWSVPASVTGGDCYDLWMLADGRLAMLVADAAGHGLAPAMVVAQVRSLVRTLACDKTPPSEVLNRVNARLSEDLSPQRFVTAVLGYLASDGSVEMASAGHGPILFSPRTGAPLQELRASGYPLVVDGEASVVPMDQLILEEGGQLVLVSDGIFEAPSHTGEHLGLSRLNAALRSQSNQPAQRQIEHVQHLVRSWSGGKELKDDQTIVIARRNV